jgi:hypothetical protein
VLVVRLAPAMHPERGLLLIKGERDGDELVLVVAVSVVAGYYNARIADLHLRPSTFGEGVDAEQTVAPIRSKNGEQAYEEVGRRGG